MCHTLSTRRRPVSPYTPLDMHRYARELGRQAREAEAAEAARIAALLGHVDPEFVREATTDASGKCWMSEDVMDALAAQAGMS